MSSGTGSDRMFVLFQLEVKQKTQVSAVSAAAVQQKPDESMLVLDKDDSPNTMKPRDR